MEHQDRTPSPGAALVELLESVQKFFDVEPVFSRSELAVMFSNITANPEFSESQADMVHLQTHIEGLVQQLHHPSNLLRRLRGSANYVEAMESQLREARASERSAKLAFLEALIDAVRPALPAISEPLIAQRVFSIGCDERRSFLVGARGVTLVDGWDRDARNGPAGRSLVLGEDGVLHVVDYTACPRAPSHLAGYHVDATWRPVRLVCVPCNGVPVDDPLDLFPRKAFLTTVDQLVGKVWNLARNPKRKSQAAESLALADKLQALRTLLHGAGHAD